MPEEPLEQERFKRQLIATARSLKKKQNQLQADQDLLNDRWTEVLATDEYSLSGPVKSYPKSRSLPQGDDRALEPAPLSHKTSGQPQLGPGKAATQAEHQTAPPRRKGKNKTAWGCAYDRQQVLGSRAGHSRATYGSRGHTSTRDHDHLFGRDKPSHARAKNSKWTRQRYATAWPNIEAPHALCASQMK